MKTNFIDLTTNPKLKQGGKINQMNILEALKNLRDDLKSWVTANLIVINNKIDENTVIIEDELNINSTNPIQNRAVATAVNELNQLVGSTPVSEQIDTAISNISESFDIEYQDLKNAPSISNAADDSLSISDDSGNIIFKVDKDGTHTTNITLNGIELIEVLDSRLSNKVDKVEGKGLSTNDFTDSDKAKLALISNGDSTYTSIDSTLSLTSENPVQNKVITAAIQENTSDIEDLETLVNSIADRPTFSGKYSDLLFAPDITENQSTDVVIADGYGNIIAKIDDRGLHSTGLVVNGENFLDTVDGKLREVTKTLGTSDRLNIRLVPSGSPILENSDLMTSEYLKVGSYYCTGNSIATTLLNCPTQNAFMMQVYSPLSVKFDNEETHPWVYRIRKIMTYKGVEYIQFVETWGTANEFHYGPWRKIVVNTDAETWTFVMDDGTTVNKSVVIG